MPDNLREVVDCCVTQRRIQGVALHPHGIVDLGPGRDFAYVPMDPEEMPRMDLALWALGAMRKRERAPFAFVAVEITGRLCHTEAEADGLMEKYGSPQEMPLDDRDRFLIISEINFENPKSSRLARVRIRGMGECVSFDAPDITASHMCRVFHPVFSGWKSGVMPPGIEMNQEFREPPDL